MDQATFDGLPLLVEGESKSVRAHPTDPNLCWIQLKPTIYSFTHNRAAVVPGSDKLRLEASKIFLRVLQQAGVDHAYVDFDNDFILARYIHNAPPIEVVVKAFHTGTSKHRYYGMGGAHKIRENHPYFAGMSFPAEGAYPIPIVRFDWRNPMWHPEKVAQLRKAPPPLPNEVYLWPDTIRKSVMIADEVLCEEQADWFIDVAQAKKTALQAYGALNDFLSSRDIILCDLCMFISSDGKTVFGEVSQDCGRFRHFDMGSIDKDVWRAGGSSAHVLEKWAEMLRVIS